MSGLWLMPTGTDETLPDGREIPGARASMGRPGSGAFEVTSGTVEAYADGAGCVVTGPGGESWAVGHLPPAVARRHLGP